MLLKARQPEIDPIQILAGRFAAGDIDEAEYAKKLHVLMTGPSPELARSPEWAEPPTSAMG
jgi:hypothetical protein